MAFIPFPSGTVEVITNMLVDGIPAVTTLGCKFVSGAATYTDGAALAALIEGSYISHAFYGKVCADVEVIDFTVNDLTSASGWQAVQSALISGTATGPAVQNQVCMVVTFQTAKRGRSYRGRNYVPGLPASELNDPKSWGTTAIGNFDNFYDDLINDIEVGGWTPGVLSRYQAKAPLTLGVFTPITTVRANAKLGTQRRRLS